MSLEDDTVKLTEAVKKFTEATAAIGVARSAMMDAGLLVVEAGGQGSLPQSLETVYQFAKMGVTSLIEAENFAGQGQEQLQIFIALMGY